jgi:sterol desaturase/sphingolipid hydroxylase (fatty acid hydroxylase superfamily)
MFEHSRHGAVFFKSAVRNRSIVREICFSIVLLVALCSLSYRFSNQKISAVITVLIFLSGYFLLSGLEHLLPTAGPRKLARRWWLYVQLTLVNLIIGTLSGAFVVSYLANFLSKRLGIQLGWIDLTLHKSHGVIGLFCAGMLGAIAGDFFYYWSHRAFHKNHILWQHHKMHHMDPGFDALTAQRTNGLESIFLGIMVFLPSAILFKTNESSFLDGGIVNGIVLYVLDPSRARGVVGAVRKERPERE